jgi:hypothetical protein
MKISIHTAALIIVTTLIASCGPGAKEKTLHSTLRSVNAARAAFDVWDDRSQDKIIAEATTLEEGEARLELHRKKQADIVAAFEATYYALVIAATNLSDQNLAKVIAAAAQLYQIYQDIIGDDPPTP